MAVKEQIIRLKYDNADANAKLAQTGEKFEEIGKKSERARDALGRFVKGADDTTKAAGGAEKSLGGFNLKLDGLSASASKLGVALGGAVAAGFAALGPALEQAQRVENVSRSFEELQEKAGQLASTTLLDLREATQGLVSDFDLMKQANQAALLGLDQSKFDEVAGAAVKLGQAVGQDAVNSIESMVGALGRNSFELLDNLGITLRVEQAHREYADQLGKTIQQLTETEKAESFRVIAMQKIIEKAAQVTEGNRTAATAWAELKVAVDNIQDSFATAISNSDLLVEGLDRFRDGLVKLSSGILNFSENLRILNDDMYAFQKVGATLGQQYVTQAKGVEDLAVKHGQLLTKIQETNKAIQFEEKVLKERGNYFRNSERIIADLQAKLGGFEASLAEVEKGLASGSLAFEDIGSIIRNTGESIVQTEKKFTGTTPKIENSANRIKQALDKIYKPSGDPFGTAGIFNTLELAEQEAIKVNERIASDQEQKMIEAQQNAYRESTDFFSEILSGVIEGDIEDVLVNMLKRAAIQFGAEMLAQLTGSFSLNGVLTGNLGGIPGVGGTPGTGQGLGGLIGGGGTGAAGASGASLASLGPLLAAVAVAYTGYRTYDSIKEGDQNSAGAWGAALGGVFTAGASYYLAGLGSNKSAEQKRRDAYRDYLFEQGIISDPNATGMGGRKAEFALFGGGYGSLSPGSEFQGVNAGAEGYVGLGNVLSSAANGGAINADLSAMFANALAEADSFNAAVLTTRGILEELGITADEAGFAMVDAYYKGEIGLDELNSGINTLVEVAKNDLPSLADGIDLFNESLDDPKSQIPALGLLFQEMAQQGIDSAEEMKAFFAENFAPEVADSLSAIVDAGIDTFDELNNLTLGQTQLVINELDAAAQTQIQYTESVKAHGDEAEKAGEKSRKALEREREQIERNKQAYEDARRAKQRYFAEGSTQDFGPQPPG